MSAKRRFTPESERAAHDMEIQMARDVAQHDGICLLIMYSCSLCRWMPTSPLPCCSILDEFSDTQKAEGLQLSFPPRRANLFGNTDAQPLEEDCVRVFLINAFSEARAELGNTDVLEVGKHRSLP